MRGVGQLRDSTFRKERMWRSACYVVRGGKNLERDPDCEAIVRLLGAKIWLDLLRF